MFIIRVNLLLESELYYNKKIEIINVNWCHFSLLLTNEHQLWASWEIVWSR